ncbi:UNVERIFIED_CONTAM: putative lysine-specific demethylase ELF6 [Sesamum indicum]
MKNVVIPKWLERLPLAPEFRPTDTEFADPIAYISKIEKEASAFGICKVIPPLPKPSRKYVLHNLNKSLSKCPELGLDASLVTSSKLDSGARDNSDRAVNSGESRAVFTTRHQELGCEKGKRVKGADADHGAAAQKQVWQSGEVYTLEQFEAKAKNFAKSQLGLLKEVNPLVIEAMFWKAASEKPIYVEYANDVPGSAFGEPEGSLRYFDRRRRRRRRKRHSFDRNNLGNSDSKIDQVDTGNSISGNNDSGSQNNHNICTETASNSLLSNQLHHGASFSGRKDFEGGDEMEGTAGWKLSNCPWNLQVIARSPGSLTRFMPDDIPGVTSPMIYIGMLFSWFAWHVEDHELHSLNFLHMGSAKTWYAVPADYAFNFEETIRLHGYGGNADRLVALSLLGEKTTVLSPEIIVASGIPCCRLVQNPGEFVVTFPRAYHIGFSHGFNCGEAANFGTPKWLTIAKEAAVRRAAMNYLPMLSHQQLLYLLTMSFISRLSSEFKEYNWTMGVLWDVESMPSSSKESEPCKETDVALTSAEKDSPQNNDDIHDLSQLSKYIGAVGFDLNDDDLAYDFQIESGTLPCVACGILGFPFMTVVQPSEVASTNLLLMDPLIVSAESGQPSELNPVKEVAAKDITDKTKLNKKDLHHVNEASSVAESSQSTHQAMDQTSVCSPSSSLEHEALSSQVKIVKGWNISNVSLKPRIFCLEHAIDIEGLLSSKGGANVLVICHSDFQKIKTHAAVIAEEIGVPFCYTDVELSNASPEDLNLIDIAIDREEQVDCAEDWTSKLSINLQHCVKVKKNSPSKNVQHLLSLGGLFCDATPISNASGVKWLSRKLRSKRHLKRLLQSKRSDSKEDMNTNEEHQMAKKDVKIIQYSRKRYKSRSSAGIQVPIESNNLVVRDTLDTEAEDLDKEDKNMSRSILTRVETNGKSFSGPSALPYDSISESLRDHPGLLSRRGSFENSFPSHHANSVITSTPIIENVEAQTSISPPNELAVSANVGSTSDENGIGNAAEDVNLQKEETMDESTVATRACDQVAETDLEMLHNVQSDGDNLTKEASEHGGSSNCSDDEPPTGRDEQMEAISDQLVTESEVSKSLSSERQQHIERDGDNKGDVLGYTAGIYESTSASTEECLPGDTLVDVASHNDNGESVSLLERKDSDDANSIMAQSSSIAKTGRKRKREVNLQSEDQFHVGGFIRGPCEGLRPRAREVATGHVPDNKKPAKETPTLSKVRKATDHSVSRKDKKENQKGRYKCELDGCTMSFQTKAELLLHKGNRCPVEGCRKKFNSHKYAIQHQRVHDDDRPLKCPWDGCTMSFKWAWARTEHLRVHTGERPYVCKVKGCGLTFRFVSDFSRHRRKTGHYVSPLA